MTTVDELTLPQMERAMNTLCRIMANEEPEYAEKLVPLYTTLAAEIEARRTKASVMDAARARARSLKRSPDHTAA